MRRLASVWDVLACMARDSPLRIPESLRHDTEETFELTDPFRAEHLDAEYGELVRALIAELARERPSPLARGDLRIWPGAGIYAMGSVNFLFDPAQPPHLTGDQLSELTGVPKSTLANKGPLPRSDAQGDEPMDDLDSEWQRKGATLSDTSARNQFGLTQDEIFQAMRSGKLHYREASMHGNPWFRLLRREVEALVKKKYGGDYLKDQQVKTELGGINRELKRLKTRATVLEARKAKLMADRRK